MGNNHGLCSWFCGSGIQTAHSMVSMALPPSSGPPVEDWKTWGSFTPVSVVGAGCGLRPSLGPLPAPGFLTVWWLGCKGEDSEREPRFMNSPWQSHRHYVHIVLTEDVSFTGRDRFHLLKEECRHYPEGRTCEVDVYQCLLL